MTPARGRNLVGSLVRTRAILLACERLIVAGLRRSQITQQLVSEYGITEREARQYQGSIARSWRNEALREGQEQRVERYRRQLEDTVAEAKGRVTLVCTGREPDGEKIYERIPQPDSKAAIAGLALLLKLEGALGVGDEQRPALPPANDNASADKPQLVVSTQAVAAELAARGEDGEHDE